MSWTLLDYTQAILSSLDSDEVNSIGDTVESQQVVSILRTVYEEIVTRADLSEHYSLFTLDASTDPTKPTKMIRPSDVYSLEWIKYNVRISEDEPDTYRMVYFKPLDEFLSYSYQLDSEATNVDSFEESVDGHIVKFYYTNDNAPRYWTTYNDNTILFDSYDNTIDSTLQRSKTSCYGKKKQAWTEEDTFVPFIDSEFCVLLLNEAKSLAFAELKQMAHQKAEISSRRLWSDVQKKKRSLDRNRDELDRLPNYGRTK